MKRINRLLERQIDKPHSYEELKKEPFPYLEECNRLEIFEFIHQLEIENRQLRDEVTEKHPGKTIEEIVEEDRVRKLTGQMIGIEKECIESMEVELKDKILSFHSIKQKNQELSVLSQALEGQMREMQFKLMEVAHEKRELQFELKIQSERRAKVDTSSIFQNLYRDVRQILQESL